MSRKSLMLALAAAVSLGTFALSSSNASAFHFSGGARAVGGVHLGGSGMHLGGTGSLHVNHAMKPWPTFNPHHVHVGPRWWWWRYTWRRPYWIAPVVATGAVATGAAASYATTPTNRCNCLTKDYTPQGAVVFKDLCTNEMAMNPPVSGPAADMAPQMPQQPIQQGYLQSQPSQVQ
jgi:hypothetical protein